MISSPSIYKLMAITLSSEVEATKQKSLRVQNWCLLYMGSDPATVVSSSLSLFIWKEWAFFCLLKQPNLRPQLGDGRAHGLAQAPFQSCTASDLALLLLRQPLTCMKDFASKLKSLDSTTANIQWYPEWDPRVI